MKWRLIEVQQETDHPYLNYFTLHYQVEKDGENKEVFYRICSRHSKSLLQCFANTKKLSADGVLIPIYRIEEDGSISLLFTSQFRPSFNRRLTSFCAGLVDQDDPDLFFTAVREAKEELGIEINTNDIINNYVVLRRNFFEIDGKILEPYIDYYFEIKKYNGVPKIIEEDKCDELLWADVNNFQSHLLIMRVCS